MIGGGHSHVLVLRRFAMNPQPGVRITLVSREIHTPYSGMLPGHIAGHYSYDDVHIDLGPLALAAGARLVAAEAVGLDLVNRHVEFARHPSLRFDVVSLNCGAASARSVTVRFGWSSSVAGPAVSNSRSPRTMRWSALRR
ncbi:MAG: hypothetical protein NT024_02545 [Proteobacteria bacterium]|nr:hypothetical protein [Pseudomonadota bacterium]